MLLILYTYLCFIQRFTDYGVRCKVWIFLRSVSIVFLGVAAQMSVHYVNWKQQQCVLYRESRQLLGPVVLGSFCVIRKVIMTLNHLLIVVVLPHCCFVTPC